jgi:hypothetical protein
MTGMPLAHLTVLDLTIHRAVPTAVRQLADWGASVIKIEPSGSAHGDVVGGPELGDILGELGRGLSETGSIDPGVEGETHAGLRVASGSSLLLP